MKFSGIQQFTMLDFPDRIACIVFTPGCNLRCGFCHNPEFVLPERLKKIQDTFVDEEAVIRFLKKRRGLIDGVVVSGGEPTMAQGLFEFIARVKELGFLVKLDTNGMLPYVIRKLLSKSLLDYIAMDIKTDLQSYTDFIPGCGKPERIQESVDIIMGSKVPYEFRTTIIKEHHTLAVLKNIATIVHGAERYYLQQFRSQHTLDQAFANSTPFDAEEMKSIASTVFKPVVKMADVRLAA